MFGLGAPELLLILVIALIVFGPGRLPELGGALGKGIRDFRKSFEGEKEAEAKLEDQSKSGEPSA
jgi:sec-independent protein translocase protein TatA